MGVRCPRYHAYPTPCLRASTRIIARDQECEIAIYGAQGSLNDEAAFIFVAHRKKCLESAQGSLAGARHGACFPRKMKGDISPREHHQQVVNNAEPHLRLPLRDERVPRLRRARKAFVARRKREVRVSQLFRARMMGENNGCGTAVPLLVGLPYERKNLEENCFLSPSQMRRLCGAF